MLSFGNMLRFLIYLAAVQIFRRAYTNAPVAAVQIFRRATAAPVAAV